MATAKLILDTRFKNGKLLDIQSEIDLNTYPLKLRIFHGDLSRDIPLDHKLKTSEWKDNKIQKGYPNSARANSGIQSKLSIATTLFVDHKKSIEDMNIDSVRKLVISEIEKQNSPPVPTEIKLIIDSTLSVDESMLFLAKFGQIEIDRAHASKNNGTAKWYKDGIAAIKNFNNGKDILIAEITVTFLKNFQAHHLSKEGNKKNGLSAYIRAVRALVNKAIGEKLGGKRYNGYPWVKGGYSIPSEKPKKRSAKKEVITKIRELQLDRRSAKWHAKNYLLFMYNNRGMNLIDVAKLKKEQITQALYLNDQLVAGRIEYNRSKNGKPFSIKLTKEALEILNYYYIAGKDNTDFVFPIGFTDTKQGYDTYTQKRKRINRTFGELAVEIEADELNLTTYVVRHSWAMHAKRSGVSHKMIGEGLGHDDPKTTVDYLEDFENEEMDEMNERVVA